MASLQDQLLKAGLVDKQKAKQASKEKRQQARLARKSGGKTDDASKTDASRRHAERVERDRALNRRKQEIAAQKAVGAEIRQLIEVNKLDRAGGEISYRFEQDNRIREILVTEEQKKHLTSGHLAIVATLGRFEIVAVQIARKIAERDAQAVVLLNDGESPAVLEDDPYAAYQIPDDLTW